MTASEILEGIIPADEKLHSIFVDMIREDAIPTSYLIPLQKIVRRYGLLRGNWHQDPDKVLVEIMAVGNDLIGILEEMVKSESFPWQYKTEIEDALVTRGNWAAQYEERKRGVPVIFGINNKRAN